MPPDAHEDLRLLSTYQVAVLLGCSTDTVRRKVKDGRIVAVRDGKTLRVPLANLRAYVNGLKPSITKGM